jgi:tetratricopeptide (TPR) repeat protein
MRLPRWSSRLLTFLPTLYVSTSIAVAQNFPLGVVSHWQYYNNAGWIAFQNGDYVKAGQKFDAAIQILRPYQKIDQRLLARSYSDFARVLYAQKRYADAEPLAKWALQVREADPRIKPDAVFQSVLLLAQIQREQRRDKEAEPLFKQALALQIQALGAEHYQIALTLDDLAAISVNLGKYPEAETLYRRAIAIHEKINPLKNLALAETLEHYAAFLRRINRAADAGSNEFRARTIRNTHAAGRAKADANRLPQGFER